MRKHTISATRLIAPALALGLVAGVAACGSDTPPTVTKTETTHTTTTPGYVAPAPLSTGTTTTQRTTTY